MLYDLRPNENLIQAIDASLQQLTKGKVVFTTISEASVGDGIYVFMDLDQPYVSCLDEDRLGFLQSLFGKAKGVLWISQGAHGQGDCPEADMSIGMIRCIRAEIGSVNLVHLSLDNDAQNGYQQNAQVIARLVSKVFGAHQQITHMDMEYRASGGALFIPRLILDDSKDKYINRQTSPPVAKSQRYHQPGRKMKMTISNPGLLETIVFVDERDSSYATCQDKDAVHIDVQATGMNFKDLMIGLGQVPYQDVGFECAGTVINFGSNVYGLAVGDRVCAITDAAFANYARANHQGVIKVPDSMSFAVAASIPIIYCTAYHGLFDIGRLQKGESVLIHAAAGGVGQAAIMMAQWAGAEVFVTVGSAEKKDLVMNTYKIPDDHIFASRDTTFEQGILAATHGKGVNVVLNSTAGEQLRLSFNLLAPLGRFIEIGKRDIELNTRLEMNNFSKATTFAAVDLNVLAKLHPPSIQTLLTKVFALLTAGDIQPVTPVTTYTVSEVEKALRQMQSGKHMGKIVIETHDTDMVNVRLPRPRGYDTVLISAFRPCQPPKASWPEQMAPILSLVVLEALAAL